MTIASETNRWAYSGDGLTLDFDYTNKIFASTDLQVFLDGVLQTETTHYTVSGVGVEAGGSVQFLAAPANAASVVIVRDVPAVQGTDLPIGGSLPSTTVEESFDKLTVLVQQNADKIARALVLAESDTGSIGTLPDQATRASKYLAFDGDGNPTAGVSLAEQTVTHVTDVFSGDGVETDFTLSTSPASTTATDVFISGVRQRPTTDYTVSGATLSFTSAPPTGTDNILAIARATFAGVPTDGSVSAIKLAAGAVGTAALADDAVTSAKIVGSAVTSAKIAAGAVTEAKLAAGVVGLPRSYLAGMQLANNGTDADHDIDIAVGECRDFASATDIVLASALTKQIDASWAAGTDAGGLSSALTLAADTWYHVHAILVGGNADVGFDTSVIAANLVANDGATAYRRLGSVLTDGSLNIIAFRQDGDTFTWNASPGNDLNQAVSTTEVLAVHTVPTGVKVRVFGGIFMQGHNTTGTRYCRVTDPDVSSEAAGSTNANIESNIIGFSGERSHGAYFECTTNTSAQLAFIASASFTMRTNTHGWFDRRGKDD